MRRVAAPLLLVWPVVTVSASIISMALRYYGEYSMIKDHKRVLDEAIEDIDELLLRIDGIKLELH